MLPFIAKQTCNVPMLSELWRFVAGSSLVEMSPAPVGASASDADGRCIALKLKVHSVNRKAAGGSSATERCRSWRRYVSRSSLALSIEQSCFVGPLSVSESCHHAVIW